MLINAQDFTRHMLLWIDATAGMPQPLPLPWRRLTETQAVDQGELNCQTQVNEDTVHRRPQATQAETMSPDCTGPVIASGNKNGLPSARSLIPTLKLKRSSDAQLNLLVPGQLASKVRRLYPLRWALWSTGREVGQQRDNDQGW